MIRRVENLLATALEAATMIDVVAQKTNVDGARLLARRLATHQSDKSVAILLLPSATMIEIVIQRHVAGETSTSRAPVLGPALYLNGALVLTRVETLLAMVLEAATMMDVLAQDTNLDGARFLARPVAHVSLISMIGTTHRGLAMAQLSMPATHS